VDSRLILYRRLFVISFRQNATPEQISGFFTRFSAEIVGGEPRGSAYYVRIPDPGPAHQDLLRVVREMAAYSGLDYVVPLRRESPPPELQGRYPVDGATLTAAAWRSTSLATWPARAVDAPLAWVCEAGIDGAPAPRVGVLEHRFGALDDLGANVAALRYAGRAEGRFVPAEEVSHQQEHGSATFSLIAAVGDNRQGIAGQVWRAQGYGYGMASGAADPFAGDEVIALARPSGLTDRILEDKVSVLSVSTGPGLASDSAEFFRPRRLEQIWAGLLRDNPRLLVVVGTGQPDPLKRLPSQFNPADSTTLRAQAFSQVAALSRLSAIGLNGTRYDDQIIIVAGAAPGPRFSRDSDWILGATDVVAPADSVTVLAADGVGTRLASGTSYAAPIVAGVAAQLLAADSSLTPAELKSYIVDGSRTTIDLLNGAIGLRDPLPGLPVLGSPVNLVNAYTSLRLLAQDRPNVPLCGTPVRLRFGPDAALEIRPRGAAPVVVPAGPDQQWFRLSPAPGGRVVSIDGFLSGPGGGDRLFTVRLTPTGWALAPGAESGVWRRIHTTAGRLDVVRRFIPSPTDQPYGRESIDLIRHRASGVDTLRDLAAPFQGSARSSFIADAWASPDGRWLFFETAWGNSDIEPGGPGSGGYRAVLRPLDGPGASVVLAELLYDISLLTFPTPTGLAASTSLAWRDDGAEFWQATRAP
jgi:hypothetical protein